MNQLRYYESWLFKHQKRRKGWYAPFWRKHWFWAREKCWITSWLKIALKDAEILRGRLLASCFKMRLKKSVRCYQCGLQYKHGAQCSNLINSALYYCPKSQEELLSCEVQLPVASWTPAWEEGELMRWTTSHISYLLMTWCDSLLLLYKWTCSGTGRSFIRCNTLAQNSFYCCDWNF